MVNDDSLIMDVLAALDNRVAAEQKVQDALVTLKARGIKSIEFGGKFYVVRTRNNVLHLCEFNKKPGRTPKVAKVPETQQTLEV